MFNFFKKIFGIKQPSKILFEDSILLPPPIERRFDGYKEILREGDDLYLEKKQLLEDIKSDARICPNCKSIAESESEEIMISSEGRFTLGIYYECCICSARWRVSNEYIDNEHQKRISELYEQRSKENEKRNDS